jgi:PPOX class probable F420-dependent enzyme
MARKMSSEQAYRFLAEGRRTGKVATVRADGRPHVAPIWFALDGKDLVFTTGTESVKGRTLRRDPRLALVVDLEAPPYAFVLVEGTATLSEDLAEMLPLATAIGARYMGEELAAEFGRRNAAPGELLVRLTPSKIVAFDDLVGD